MQIKIPLWLISAWTALEDFMNVPLWKGRRFEIRIIDIVIAAGFFFCLAYYWFAAGDWRGAVAGAVMYLLVLATALMMRA